MVNKMVNKIRKKLTERQKKVLGAIEEFILAQGYSPTIRQLGEILNIVNPSAVFKHTQSLEKKGYLERMKGELKLKGFPALLENQTRVPLVGLVPAGEPKEVFDVSGEAVEVPDWMVGRKKGTSSVSMLTGKVWWMPTSMKETGCSWRGQIRQALERWL